MARNQKLTGVIRGRRLVRQRVEGNLLILSFDDGSTMTVKLGEPPPDPPVLGIVKAVRQRGTTLSLDHEDGSTLELATAEATSCVMVRDGNGIIEYVD